MAGIINDEEDISLYGQLNGRLLQAFMAGRAPQMEPCVDGIREVADMAADMGITLGVAESCTRNNKRVPRIHSP